MRFTTRPPNPNQMRNDHARLQQTVTRVSGDVNDRATREGQQRQRSAMKAAGLGNLDRVVKAETGRSKDRRGEANAFGVIFAADGDESRGGQALQIYSTGGVINPVKGGWLWFQTDKLARTVKIPGETRRGRLTPERYRKMGSPLGPLQFARITPRLAKLYVETANISVKTGRASPVGKRASRTKVRMQRVTIFFGIKVTRRGARFDPQRIVTQSFGEIPAEIAKQMAAASPTR